MKINKILFALFSFILFFTFTSKVNATNISYCTYDEDLSLVLPVTIIVDIDAIDLMYPFNDLAKKHYTVELFVHDKKTCENGLSLPYIDEKRYFSTYSYYYKYNNSITPISAINNGVFSQNDITPPTITSFIPTIFANVNSYLELDSISQYITSFDETDGSIYPEITFDGYSENFDKVGEYSIIFEACDSSNNCSSLLQKIKVEDITPPIITGPTYFYSYISKPLTLTEISLSIKGIDNHDGDISNQIYVCDTNYKTTTPKTYYANFCLNDSSNNTSIPFKVEIETIDDIPPSIEGPTIFNSYLSNPLLVNNVLSNIIVSDNADSNVQNNIYIIDDNYTKNSKKIGEYTLILSAYDCYGNEAKPYILTINVIDNIAPTIDGEIRFESFLSAPITLIEIKSSLIAWDNHDGNLFNKLEIVDDTYSNSKDILGIHFISFIVTDSSNNESNTHVVQIVIYDDIPPTIDGKNFYITLNTQKLDVESIKLSLIAIDNIDGNISETIILDSNTYTDNHYIEGVYFLTFYVVDSSGNISDFFKTKIEVSEDLSLIQSLNNSTIYISTNELKTDEEILEILGINTFEFSNIKTLENTYEENYNKTGDYLVIFQIENASYNKEELKVNVKTYETPNTSNIATSAKNSQKKETIFSKIVSFIKSLFTKLLSFFRKLFS